jgi:dodecin
VSEVVGASPNGINAAIQVADTTRALSTSGGLDWFEVTEIRGDIADGSVAHHQVASRSASA